MEPPTIGPGIVPVSPKNPPRDWPVKLDPRRPRDTNPIPDSHALTPTPLLERLRAVVDQFGQGKPKARGQIEDYLLHRVLGRSIAVIARDSERPKSTVQSSIERGRQIVHRGADARGFQDPEMGYLRRDADDERGWSNPDREE